jgi:hypothetical protein
MTLQAVTQQNLTLKWLLAKGTLLGLVSALALFGTSPGKKRYLFPLVGHATHTKVLTELIYTSLKNAVLYTHETPHYGTFFSLPSKLTP